jgi:hypothetical protein
VAIAPAIIRPSLSANPRETETAPGATRAKDTIRPSRAVAVVDQSVQRSHSGAS